MRSSKLIKGFFVFALVGCSRVSTGIECDPLPYSYKEENPDPIPEVMEWWHIFNDPLLNDLETKAIAQSPTIDKAISIVLEARARYYRLTAELWPNLTLDPVDQQTGSLQPFLPVGNPVRQHLRQYTLPLDLVWEIDLFGKRGYTAEAGYNSLQAEKAAFWGARLTLTSDVATTYFRLRSNLTLKKILQDTLAFRKEALEVNQARYDGGLINYLDVSRAALEVSRAQTFYEKIDEDILQDKNQLAFLIGDYASNFDIDVALLKESPPPLSAGIPSDLLLNRPDLIEAYFNMRAQGDTVKAKKADLFPTFIITGTLGFFSPTSSEMFSWQSRLWEWVAQATQTIYDFGRKTETIDENKAIFRQTVDDYQQGVLNAIREVENALVIKRLSAIELKSIRSSIEWAQLTTDLARERYLRGLINYLDEVDAERDLLSAQSDEVDTLFKEYQGVINLARAIGGTFADKFPCECD